MNKDSTEEGQALLETIPLVINYADVEDFELNCIMNYSCDKRCLHFLVELKDGSVVGALFNQLKQDYPYEVAAYIKNHVLGAKEEIITRNRQPTH